MAYICPINGEKINEPTVRIVAALVMLLAMIGIYFHSIPIFLLLVYDFFVRGFWKREYSPLRRIAIAITKFGKFKMKLIDAAPKQFAAKIGCLFACSISTLLFLHFITAALVVTIVLLICAFLESVFAFCLGCEFYSFFYSAKDYFKRGKTPL